MTRHQIKLVLAGKSSTPALRKRWNWTVTTYHGVCPGCSYRQFDGTLFEAVAFARQVGGELQF